MSEIPKLTSIAANGVAAGVDGARDARVEQAAQPGGPAFEALLERLTARAADLQEQSRTLEAPEELPRALDAARSSLEDALTLGEELLEAYRAAQRAPEVAP